MTNKHTAVLFAVYQIFVSVTFRSMLPFLLEVAISPSKLVKTIFGRAKDYHLSNLRIKSATPRLMKRPLCKDESGVRMMLRPQPCAVAFCCRRLPRKPAAQGPIAGRSARARKAFVGLCAARPYRKRRKNATANARPCTVITCRYCLHSVRGMCDICVLPAVWLHPPSSPLCVELALWFALAHSLHSEPPVRVDCSFARLRSHLDYSLRRSVCGGVLFARRKPVGFGVSL